MKERPERYKKNEFIIEGNIVKVFDLKNKIFLINLESINFLDDYCWSVAKNGYVIARKRDGSGNVFIQNLIMNFVPNAKKNNQIVDHRDRNPSNNLLSNLRMSTISQNNCNKTTRNDSSSGITGVSKTEDGTWHYYIQVEGKRIGKRAKTFEEAVKQRLLLEKEYYGEYSPQKHLFEEYGIEID